MGHHLTLSELLLNQIGEVAYLAQGTNWEVGRLVLAPEYRSDVDALKHCLFLSLDYACVHTKVDSLYASCTHALGRLYRRFAFSVLAPNVLLPGTEKTYTVIHGHAPKVLGALSGARQPGASV